MTSIVVTLSRYIKILTHLNRLRVMSRHQWGHISPTSTNQHTHTTTFESQADRFLILQLSVSVHGVDGELNLSVSG